MLNCGYCTRGSSSWYVISWRNYNSWSRFIMRSAFNPLLYQLRHGHCTIDSIAIGEFVGYVLAFVKAKGAMMFLRLWSLLLGILCKCFLVTVSWCLVFGVCVRVVSWWCPDVLMGFHSMQMVNNLSICQFFRIKCFFPADCVFLKDKILTAQWELVVMFTKQ